jgi:hypothetical protein
MLLLNARWVFVLDQTVVCPRLSTCKTAALVRTRMCTQPTDVRRVAFPFPSFIEYESDVRNRVSQKWVTRFLSPFLLPLQFKRV